MTILRPLFYLALLAFIIAAPFLAPDFKTQLATLWVFIILAMTWDMTGGQMGYNSLGNILFFGAGMYIAAIVTIAIAYDVGEYTNAFGGGVYKFTNTQYFVGMGLGLLLAGLLSAAIAWIMGYLLFQFRGPYFAIGTLGAAIAAGELVSNWEWVGGGQGIALPVYPSTDPEMNKFFFYYLFAATGVILFIFLRWLYGTRFAGAINAIRDDEEKAEAMGLHTLRYKQVTWAISAFFVGIVGGISGFQNIHFEPLETAFQTINLGIFMVVCVLLGGKGTLWGPIIGAILFHVVKEVTWNYLLGWQWVALGALIVITVVYFQDGLMGWLARVKPEWFGERVQKKPDMIAEPAE